MNNDIVKRDAAATALTKDNILKQMELLKEKFKLPESSIERHYVRVEKMKLPNGNEREIYTLCKREKPITLYTDTNGAVCASMAVGYAGRMKLDVKKGKYNDESRLDALNNFETSVDVKEVAAFATI